MPLSTTAIDVNRATTGVALPSDLIDTVIQKTVEGSAVMTLANRMTIPGSGVTMNVITGDPAPAWTAESTEKTVSEPTFANKVMQPYKLAVIVPFSDQFRRDIPALYNAVAERIPYALSKKFDETVFFGTAPGTNFDTLASATAADLEAAPVGAINSAMTDIAIEGGTANGIVVSPQGYGILAGATNTQGDLIYGGSYNAAGRITPFGLTTIQTSAAYKAGSSAANTVGFVGDWSKAYYGVVQDISVEYSNQATLNDGTNTINLWQRNMFAVRVEMEVGFIVADDAYFIRLTDTYSAG